jgi:hypothetical protein
LPSLFLCQYFSLNKNTGKGISDLLPPKNGEGAATFRRTVDSPATSGRTFKESPAVPAHVSRVNGETKKVEDSAKWQSLSSSTVSAHKEGPEPRMDPKGGPPGASDPKEEFTGSGPKVGTGDKDRSKGGDDFVFARPTLPARKLQAMLPPSLPGKRKEWHLE